VIVLALIENGESQRNDFLELRLSSSGASNALIVALWIESTTVFGRFAGPEMPKKLSAGVKYMQ